VLNTEVVREKYRGCVRLTNEIPARNFQVKGFSAENKKDKAKPGGRRDSS